MTPRGWFQIKARDVIAELPLPATAKWPMGVFDKEVFSSATVQVSLFAPQSTDFQTPHPQHEFYFIVEGSGRIDIDGSVVEFAAGDAIFVPKGMSHRFEVPLNFTSWVVFFGPDPDEVGTTRSASTSGEVEPN